MRVRRCSPDAIYTRGFVGQARSAFRLKSTITVPRGAWGRAGALLERPTLDFVTREVDLATTPVFGSHTRARITLCSSTTVGGLGSGDWGDSCDLQTWPGKRKEACLRTPRVVAPYRACSEGTSEHGVERKRMLAIFFFSKLRRPAIFKRPADRSGAASASPLTAIADSAV